MCNKIVRGGTFKSKGTSGNNYRTKVWINEINGEQSIQINRTHVQPLSEPIELCSTLIRSFWFGNFVLEAIAFKVDSFDIIAILANNLLNE